MESFLDFFSSQVVIDIICILFVVVLVLFESGRRATVHNCSLGLFLAKLSLLIVLISTIVLFLICQELQLDKYIFCTYALAIIIILACMKYEYFTLFIHMFEKDEVSIMNFFDFALIDLFIRKIIIIIAGCTFFVILNIQGLIDKP